MNSPMTRAWNELLQSRERAIKDAHAEWTQGNTEAAMDLIDEAREDFDNEQNEDLVETCEWLWNELDGSL